MSEKQSEQDTSIFDTYLTKGTRIIIIIMYKYNIMLVEPDNKVGAEGALMIVER